MSDMSPSFLDVRDPLGTMSDEILEPPFVVVKIQHLTWASTEPGTPASDVIPEVLHRQFTEKDEGIVFALECGSWVGNPAFFELVAEDTDRDLVREELHQCPFAISSKILAA
ncbi:hypothetical protein ACYOEI_08985 [Singulisphaera rosea]